MSRWLAVLLLCASACGAAAQRVVAVPDGAVVKVALNQPNLVEAGEGRIAAFVFTEGKFTETIDAESGVLYLRPLEPGAHSGFIEVVGTDGRSRIFNLVLVSDGNLAAQRIVLADRSAPAPAPQAHKALAGRHVAQIKRLLRQMFDARSKLQPVRPKRFLIGAALELTRLAKLEQGALSGELLNLRNFSSAPVDVTEAMLHVRDDIVAVVAGAPTLGPGAQGAVYLVRARRNSAAAE